MPTPANTNCSLVGVGHPMAMMPVRIDTGTHGFWMDADCSTARKGNKRCLSGQYDPDESETLRAGPLDDDTYTATYGPATKSPKGHKWAEWELYTDDIHLPEVTIANQTFGLAIASNRMADGVLGLSPHPDGDDAAGHKSLLTNMVEQDIIQSRAFSLDLRHLRERTGGSVLFGGIDNMRYYGNLTRVPMIDDKDGSAGLNVQLNGIGFSHSVLMDAEKDTRFDVEGSDGNVRLNSGSVFSYLPESVAQPILDHLGAVPAPRAGGYYCPCEWADKPGSINFWFGDQYLRVPLNEFIFRSGDKCIPAVKVTEDDEPFSLGSAVLRSGYFVFDMDNKDVHIGIGVDCGGFNVTAIGTGPDAVPQIEGDCPENFFLYSTGP